MQQLGFLRESTESAIKAGIDKSTNLHRTGLNEYLSILFPETNDWIHDKSIGYIDQVYCRKRPDYRSESLKLIIEFDGLHHYTNPEIVLNDIEITKFYESLNYKVIRIPYFIQLTTTSVKTLFDIDVKETLFDDSLHSLSISARNTPAYLCMIGLQRMANEFKMFPEQYKVNVLHLQEFEDVKTGLSFLEKFYNNK